MTGRVVSCFGFGATVPFTVPFAVPFAVAGWTFWVAGGDAPLGAAAVCLGGGGGAAAVGVFGLECPRLMVDIVVPESAEPSEPAERGLWPEPEAVDAAPVRFRAIVM
jgi:hypothetical protein